MKINEITYPELANTRGNWAPYYVRRIERPEGIIYVVFQQSHEIGSARLSRDGEHITDVNVLPEHQGRGIATALYQHIEQDIGQRLKPAFVQTNAGKKLWASRTRP
jgi:ribosomal protein S18 acetylase RimI-like enzyme